jgi:hypothetical protein
MLYETLRGMRRLYREADQSPSRPPWQNPADARAGKEGWLSGIFETAGAGKEVFAGEDPDEYVRCFVGAK